MTERAPVMCCPYCGDEDLRPQADPRGSWLCGSCRRVFSVTLFGLALPEVVR